ncbi:uncharacterized protein LOC144608364 [Rhinoraja longicauda]
MIRQARSGLLRLERLKLMDRDESAVTANSRKKVVINLPRSESSFEDFILRCSKEVKQHGGGRGSYLHMALNKEEHALDEDGAKGDAAPSTLKKPRRKVSFLDVGPMNGDETAGAIALVCDQVIKANKVQQPAKPQTWHLPEGPLRNAPPSLAGNDKPTDVNQSTNVQRLQMGPRRETNVSLSPVPVSKPVRGVSQASWQRDQHQPPDPFVRKAPSVTVKWVSAPCYPQHPMLIPRQMANPLYPRYTMGQHIHAYLPRTPLMYNLVPVEQLPIPHTMGQRLPRIWSRAGAPLRPYTYAMDQGSPIMSCPSYMNIAPSGDNRPDLGTSTTF